MSLLESIGELLRPFAPVLAVVAAVLVCLLAVRWLLLRQSLALGSERRLTRRLVMLGLSVIGVIAIVFALPVENTTRNQLLTVLGLLASGIVALSSTTLVANAMAGLMLHSTRRFRTGDFIRVGGHFGRVSERGLLDTEIQTEDRDLTMLPNLYLISNPVTVVRTSGTLVSVSLSLGYDVHHARVEPLLLEAAKRAELEEPFVRLLELGNFAVTYRISGFLTDIKKLLTVRSNLYRMVLDVLHGEGIEIVSPSFMNQRPVPQDGRVIPSAFVEVTGNGEQRAPEDLMFDKAERAERVEGHRLRLASEIAKLEGRLGEAKGDERTQLEDELARRRKQLAALGNAPAKAKA